MTSVINKGDVVYWARIIHETGIYEVLELKIRTVEPDYFVGTEKRSKQAFIFPYDYVGETILKEREPILRMVQEAEKNKKEFTTGGDE